MQNTEKTLKIFFTEQEKVNQEMNETLQLTELDSYPLVRMDSKRLSRSFKKSEVSADAKGPLLKMES